MSEIIVQKFGGTSVGSVERIGIVANIVAEASKATGGKGGGGRPDLAQAGGVDSEKVELAISKIEKLIQSKAS